jgi:hypothetical protein
MTSYVLVGVERTSKSAGVLLSIIRMEPLSQSSVKGFCVMEHLTPTSKLGLEMGLQLSIGLVMAVVYASVTLCAWCWRWGHCGQCRRLVPLARLPCGRGSGWATAAGGSDTADRTSQEPLIAPTQQAAGYGATVTTQYALEVEAGGSNASLDSGSLRTGEGGPGMDRGPGSLKGPLPRRVKLVTAATNFAITAHTALMVATLAMLQCVRVSAYLRVAMSWVNQLLVVDCALGDDKRCMHVGVIVTSYGCSGRG